jgi:hypothetical protein
MNAEDVALRDECKRLARALFGCPARIVVFFDREDSDWTVYVDGARCSDKHANRRVHPSVVSNAVQALSDKNRLCLSAPTRKAALTRLRKRLRAACLVRQRTIGAALGADA